MIRRMVGLTLNLAAGNAILWGFESERQQTGVEPRLIIAFSLTAIFLLLGAFRFLSLKTSWVLTIVLSAAVTFLIPIIALPLTFINTGSINGTVNGLLVGFVVGLGFSWWGLPLFIMNVILFRWIAKGRRQG